MSFSKEIAFRIMKKEFDRFPNLELAETIELGQIGFYDSRKALFDWRTNLSSLGITISPKKNIDLPPIIDEVYTSEDSVKYEFSLEEGNLGKVFFSFSKKNSIVTQANEMRAQGYEISKLENLLLEYRKNGGKWDEDWIVVTQTFNSPSFSLLISSGKNSHVEISTQVPIAKNVFNIADPKLDLAITKSHKLAFSSLAKQNVTPFFRVHKFSSTNSKSKTHLFPYGRQE